MTDTKKTNRTIDEMIEFISKEENLIEMLKEFEIADVDHTIGIERYPVSDYRAGLIFTVQEKRLAATTKILIDLNKGIASVAQVHDALYNQGKDCDIRIIIDSNGEGEYDQFVPTVNQWVVSGLISRLQEDNIPILMLNIDQKTLRLQCEYNFQDWSSINRLKPSGPIPSREQFTAETFWAVYFDSNTFAYYSDWEAYSGHFMNIKNSWITIYTEEALGGEIRPYWDEDGLRFEITQTNDSDQYLKKILNTLMPELKTRYGESNVEFENVVGKLPRLYIKYSDKPFSWLYDAVPVQITEFAREVYDDVWDLRSKLDEAEQLLFQPTDAQNYQMEENFNDTKILSTL